MKVESLQKALKIIQHISNQGSISELFRCTEVSSSALRACSEFGNAEYWVDLPEVTSAKLINTAALVAIASHLPENEEINLLLHGDKLTWKCGSAKGQLAFSTAEQQIPLIQHTSFPWTPPKELGDALSLASAACQAMTVSVGLYGLQVEPKDGNLRMTSSNAISLATAKIALDGYPFSTLITLRPPIPRLIATVLDTASNCKVDVCEEGVFVLGDEIVTHFPLSHPLEHDLGLVIERFSAKPVDVVKVSDAAITNFLARAKALSDRGIAAEITLEILDGSLLLKQTGVASSSEEFFLAEGLDVSKKFNSVVIPLSLMVEAMRHTKTACLDYLSQNVFILAGDKPEFMHVIGGKAK